MLTAEQIRSTERAASIQSIMAPVNGHLAALSEFLEEQVATFETELQAMVHYCLSNQGKRIRPMLMFFSAWEEEPSEPNPDLIRAAAVVELVHLATLVHDDILDAAAIRHNSETASAKWGADAAVLLGDALFAQALHLATDFSTVTVCRAVSASTRRVCAGEIRQTFERGNSSLSLDDYFHVIDLKTAELFKVSCFLGAHLVGFTDERVAAYAEFGRRLGVAYQIFDDMADILGDESKIGKTLGTDLASGKFTLPLLLLRRKTENNGRIDWDVVAQDGFSSDHPEIADSLHGALTELGIQEEVAARFETELVAGDAALKPYAETPSAQRLLSLSQFVRGQMKRVLGA